MSKEDALIVTREQAFEIYKAVLKKIIELGFDKVLVQMVKLDANIISFDVISPKNKCKEFHSYTFRDEDFSKMSEEL
jgi:hypothetical protein